MVITEPAHSTGTHKGPGAPNEITVIASGSPHRDRGWHGKRRLKSLAELSTVLLGEGINKSKSRSEAEQKRTKCFKMQSY